MTTCGRDKAFTLHHQERSSHLVIPRSGAADTQRVPGGVVVAARQLPWRTLSIAAGVLILGLSGSFQYSVTAPQTALAAVTTIDIGAPAMIPCTCGGPVWPGGGGDPNGHKSGDKPGSGGDPNGHTHKDKGR